MTEKEKKLAGEVYSAIDPQLLEELKVAREKIYEYNALRPSETDKMKEIIKDLFGHVGDNNFLINQPFRCDYGKQISIGQRFFANFNFTVLDEAPVIDTIKLYFLLVILQSLASIFLFLWLFPNIIE